MTQLSFFNAFVCIGQIERVDTVCFCAFIMALSFVLTPLLHILLGTTHWKMGVLIESNTVRKNQIRSSFLIPAKELNEDGVTLKPVYSDFRVDLMLQPS